MTKKFNVSVDITVSATVEVEATNAEEAKTIARNYVGDDYQYYCREAESMASCEVTGVEEANQ